MTTEPKRRGRPPATDPRPPVTLRLDPDTARHLRASGPGWQTRVAAAVADLVAKGKL